MINAVEEDVNFADARYRLYRMTDTGTSSVRLNWTSLFTARRSDCVALRLVLAWHSECLLA